MGSPIERYLNGPSDTSQLDLSVKTGLQQPADQAARILKLQMRTGLSTDFVTRNLDSLEKQAKSADFNPAQYQQASPGVAQWIAENPQHAAVAAPDLKKLSYLERQIGYIKNQFEEGQLSNELQSIGESAILGTITPAQRARQQEIEQTLHKPDDFGITGFFEGIPGAIANQLPMLGNVLKGKVEAAGVGAGAAALAGLVTGPGEVLSIPAGATLGWRYGTAIAMARQEAALSYLEFEKLRDENGQPLDRTALLGASMVDGVINGALASVGAERILKNVPGLRTLGRSELRAALASQTARGAMIGFLRNVGESAGTMGVVSFLQTIIRHGAGEVAELLKEGKTLSPGQVLDRLFPPDVMEQAKTAAVSGVQAGAGLGVATAGAALPFDLQRAARADRNARVFQNIGETLKDSQLMEKLPEKMQEVVHRLSSNTAAEHVYVPTQFWNEYWQGQKLNPGDVAQEVLGDRAAYDEAQRTGSDIPIPLSRFATIIASTEHLQKFIPELRTAPDEMNQREAQEHVAALDAQDQAAQQTNEASVGQVQSIVAQQLVAAGFDEAQAETQSKIYASTFRALGQRMGQDPYELFKSYNLKISRNEEGVPTPDATALAQEFEQRARPQKFVPSQRLLRLDDPLNMQFEDVFLLRGEDTNVVRAIVSQNVRPDEEPYRVTFMKWGGEDGIEMLGHLPAATMESAAALAQQYGFVPEGHAASGGIKFDYGRPDTFNQDIVPEPLRAALEQTTTGEARGRIRIGANEISIELLKNADLSTFLHETGHFYLHVLTDLATRSDVPEAITRDFDVVSRWLESESGDFTRAQHEKFARGFEAYLMEGKAPSAELRGPFARFRAWLTSIYKEVRNLGVTLNPEIRQVFDRLVAADDEIIAAEGEQVMLPLFGDPAAVGMNEVQAARYQADVNAAHDAASTEMANKVARSYQREQRKVWKDELNKQREVAATEANGDPTLRARSILERGKMPDGGDLPAGTEPIKLSYTSIRAYFGEATADSLGRMVSRRGGLHPDVAADVLGFSSGDELVQALTNSEPPSAWIERMATSRAMDALKMLTPAELQEEAMKAVHTEKRAQLLQKELQWLASNELATVKGLVRRLSRRIPLLDAVREQAQQIVRSKTVRDINPRLYQVAEQKSAKLAMDLFLKGDIESAFDEKQRQLLNFELYRAASDAREQVDKITGFMSRFDNDARRRRLAKAGHTYLDQIDALMQQYEFSYRSGPELAKRQSLLDFVQEQKDQGYTPDIPDELLTDARKINYRDLPYERLSQIYTTAFQIEHLARTKNDLLKSQQKRTFAETKDAMVSSIAANHEISVEPIELAHGLRDRIKSGTRGLIAAHTKPEFLFEWLDGNKEQGPLWTQLFKPLAQAENDEHVMMRVSTKALNEIFDTNYTRAERSTWHWHKEKFEGMPAFTKASKLALALNWGNDYNKQAVMDGYQWTEAQVQKVLDTLDERDWKAVQAIWDHLDTYWPQISALEKRLNGLAPEKVKASPITTKFGEMRGGYYPVVFDRNLSWRPSLVNTDRLDAQARGSWAFKQTLHGHVKERTDSNGQPIKLDLSGLTSHISNVVHDLTHREAIIDVRRLANHDEVRGAIEGSVGRQMWRQINPWLDYVAVGSKPDFANPIEGILNRARMGATIVNMGWKVTTALSQLFSYTNTVKEIGAKYSTLGIVDTYAQPWKIKAQYDFVTSRSEFMKDRLQTYDRDVNDALKRLNVAGVKAGPLSGVDAYTVGLRDTWFKFIGLMDMGASLPSWNGAYRKAMEGQVEGLTKGNEFHAIDYADKVVRQTQGVGSPKDLALVQRGPEAYRLFTMFYSYWNVLYNQFAKTTHQYQLDRATGSQIRSKATFIASMSMLWFVPAVMQELVTGRSPSPDDDSDKWWAWFAKNELQYPFQTVILLRDIVNGMTHNGYEPSAAFEMFDSITKSGQAVAQRVTGQKDELTRSDAKNMAQAVGYTTRLPSKQLWLTGEYLYDWWTGDEQVDNPMEAAWRSLVTGKKKE
jgi:hypothetical protein